MTDSNLPTGWLWSSVSELGEDAEQAVLTGPFGSKLKTEDFCAAGVPVLTIGCLTELGLNLDKANYISATKAQEFERYRLKQGDILFSRMASVGRACTVPEEYTGAIFNYHIMRLRLAPSSYDKQLFVFYVRGSNTVRQYLKDVNHGATRDGINTTQLLALPVPLPPLNEQRRIVAKIEALQARSEAAKQALDAIGPLLEQFRQSVLAAAFRGDLTASWREQHPDVEPASALLERIRVERKARFIAAAGDKARAKAEAKARAAGKSWTEADTTAVVENARAKAEAQYVEPEPVDATGLPELPAGWCWARTEEICELVTKGTTPKSEQMRAGNGEIPYIKVYNLTFSGDLDFSVEPTFVDRETHSEELARSICYPGDVLMNIVGPPLGKVSIVPNTYPEWNINQAIVRYRPIEPGLSACLSRLLQAQFALDWMAARAKATSGQLNLTLEICRDLPVPIPPLSEQEEIGSIILHLLKTAEQNAAAMNAARALLDQLNQSILAKAFRGELVPQDPNDEPASVLLERIRAERTTSPAPSKKPKPQRAAPKLAPELQPTPPQPAPKPTPKPTPTPEQLDLLVHVPPERVSIEEEPTEVMAALRRILGDHTSLPRDAALRILAESLGYQRISPNLRKRLDGHLRAAVRRRILEPGHAELLRLATHRVEDYSPKDLATTLRTISRRGCVYEREELARSLLDHLGFRRMTATAKQAIESALDAAIDNGTFENVDSERLRRR